MEEPDRPSDAGGGSDDPAAVIVPIATRRRAHVAPPVPPTPLVGRVTELRVARETLGRDGVRLLTLTGPGGIGKTRFALEVATTCATAFADGVVWVPLAPVRNPDHMVSVIDAALGFNEPRESATLESVVAALRDRHALLVLDNFEQIVTAGGQVGEILRSCPHATALVTSRSPLRISGEHVIPLPPLTLPAPHATLSPDRLRQFEGIQLFIDRAAAVSPSFELNTDTAPLVAHICQRLDGLPLAIELAAARVYHLSVRTLHDRLERRLPLLTGGASDLPDRQRTLRNTIAWSHDLLDPEEQELFRELAVFVGGFTIEAAEAVGGDAATAMDRLTTLVDRSLVQHQPDQRGASRYSLLETIHEYAVEHLVSHGNEAAVRQRHAAYFLAWAESARAELMTRTGRSWLERLEADHDNLRAALTWFAHTGQWRDCLRLAAALSVFWDYRGYLTEGRAWLERALGALQAEDVDLALRASASAALGLFVLRQGDFDLAESHLMTARSMWDQIDDPAQLAHTVKMLGGVAEYRGDDTLAQTRYEEALAIFREIGDASGYAETLDNLADTAYRRGDMTSAAALAREAVTVGRNAELPVTLVAALVSVGAADSALGDASSAIAALREALELSQSVGYLLGLADAMVGLAAIAAARDPAQSARMLGAVETLTEGLGVPRLPHQTLHKRAISSARDALGENAYEASWATGRAMSAQEALDEARAVSTSPSTGAPNPLTPRERDVLQLLVTGMTDRAIGEALFIGTRTVESHVARIFEKLGVRSRAAAAAHAIAAGLATPPTPKDRYVPSVSDQGMTTHDENTRIAVNRDRSGVP